ncbi:unnamed protein product [Prorocentrum cordatum]|uniref:RNase H type-1 domain-containing protein n=1 Tax=Prorocentrum cordatum TaxID=2364126 RepID=A0ABN9PQY5_9DINO|nr:unnamed protein product [Polarella glacialis]
MAPVPWPKQSAKKEVSLAIEDGADTSSSLLEQVLPKYKQALADEQLDAVKAMELVCPELAEAAKPPPPKAPEISLEQHAATLRRLHSYQEKLKNQLVANAKHGTYLLERPEENVRACAEAQAEVNRLTSLTSEAKPASDQAFNFPELSTEDVELLTPEQKAAYVEALAHAQQAQQAYKTAADIGQKAQNAASTLRELREKAATAKRRKADSDAGVAAGAPDPAPAAGADGGEGAAPGGGAIDFSDPKNVDAYIQRTAAILARAAAADSAKRSYVYVFFGNATSYGNEVKKLIESAPYDLMGLAEHHSPQMMCQMEDKRLRNFGWRSEGTWTAASATGRSDKGTRGGACWPRRATYATSIHLEGPKGKSVHHDALRDISVVPWRFHGATFASIVCYLDCSIGLAGTSSKEMNATLRIVRTLGIPWLLVGDFNATPQEMMKSGWLKALGGTAITPEGVEVSCASGKGRMIHCVIVPDSFRPFLDRVLPVHNLPRGPHIGLNIRLTSRQASVFVRRQRLPVSLEIPLAGHRTAMGVKRSQRDRQRYQELHEARGEQDTLQQGSTPNDEDEHLMGDHYTQLRPQRCADGSWLDCAEEAPRYVDTTGVKGQWVVTESLAFQHDPHMSDDMAQQYAAWSVAAEEQLAAICGPEPRPAAHRGFTVRYQRQKRRVGPARQQTRSEIGNWAIDSTEGSMKGAHRYLKKLEQQALDETCRDAAGLEVRDAVHRATETKAARWAQRWTSQPHRLPAVRAALGELRRHAREELAQRPYHDRDALVSALRSFPKTTGKGPDQWKPTHLLALSDQGQEAFVTLLNLIERSLAWPHQLQHNRFALLPKGTKQEVGNERDIAARWDAAVQGSNALQAALLTMLDESRAHVGINERSNFLVDVKRFHDFMDLELMIRQAMDLDFQKVELYLCRLAYLAPRVVNARGAVAEAMVPNCSIVPGCGLLVLEQTKQVTVALVTGMLDMGLRVSPKSLLMTTTPEHEAIVQQHVLDTTGIQIKETKWAKDLGGGRCTASAMLLHYQDDDPKMSTVTDQVMNGNTLELLQRATRKFHMHYGPQFDANCGSTLVDTRLVQASGYQIDDDCPRCAVGKDTIAHRLYECAQDAPIEHERAYALKARAGFLDGSATSGDARLSGRMGVYFRGEGEAELDVEQGALRGLHGTIDVDQTVPASELAAMFWALQVTTGPILLWTDCQLAFDGWTQGLGKSPQWPLARWWDRIRRALETTGRAEFRSSNVFFLTWMQIPT